MINSNGFGANYRYGQRINADNKRLYEIDFAYIRDPKERRSETGAQTMIVYGKKNLAFDFRFGYGKQHEKFRKHDIGGVAIRRFYNFGPSLVLMKPIFYDRIDVTTQTIYRSSKFDPMWYSNNHRIIGRSSFFDGFDRIRVVPGAFVKFGYNFEFGSHDRNIHALEAGLIAEGFIERLEIMDFTNLDLNQRYKTAQNRQFFLTIFLSYRFGKIVDPYEVRERRERSREISY